MREYKLSVLEKITKELLAPLSSKMKIILTARFGLDGKSPETLEAIGGELGITRERVRQIEVASFKKLREIAVSEDTKHFFEVLENELEKQGGFLGMTGFMKGIFKKENIELINENQLKIILNSYKKIYYKKENSKFEGLWYLNEYKKEIININSVYRNIIKYFKKTNRPVRIDELLEVFKNDNLFDNAKIGRIFEGEYAKNRLKTLLSVGKLTDINLLQQWGIKSWKLISPRGVRERAYLVFQKHQKPLHFRDITKLINKHFDLKKPAIPETVCNAVIYFDEFIAVECGVYALVEWNLFNEEMKNKIIEFLRVKSEKNKNKKNNFIKIDEIVKHIISEQNENVEHFIVQANLFDKNLFSRRGNAYTLKQ